MILHIPNSKQKPHKIEITDKQSGKTYRRAYIRIGDKCLTASNEMVRFLKSEHSDDGITLSIGEKEKMLFRYLDKNQRATVNDFAKLVNISRRRAERLMIRLVRAGSLQIHNDIYHDYFTLK